VKYVKRDDADSSTAAAIQKVRSPPGMITVISLT
jgi:hypothetical protein